MSAIIKQLTDKEDANDLLPITNTKAVYDDAGNRLDNTLKRLDILNEFEIGGTKIIDLELRKNEKVNLLRLEENGGVLNFYTNDNGASWIGGQLAPQNTISDAYNPYKIYAQGEFCIYNNTLWKSKVSNNAGNTPAEGSYWTATNVGNEINAIGTVYEFEIPVAGDRKFLALPEGTYILNITIQTGVAGGQWNLLVAWDPNNQVGIVKDANQNWEFKTETSIVNITQPTTFVFIVNTLPNNPERYSAKFIKIK